MRQKSLPIHPPIIERRCRFGTCNEDLAYVINGIDLCFEHGTQAIESLKPDSFHELGTVNEQLELVK